MSRTLVISDELYSRLEDEAKSRGMESVERMLENEFTEKVKERQKEDAVRYIREIQAVMSAKYGLMPDSADLVREDRQR